MKIEIWLNKGGTGESRGCVMHNSSLDDSAKLRAAATPKPDPKAPWDFS